MAQVLISVGIDIGTSTTQVIFSRLTIENTASASIAPHVAIIEKQTIYRSPIYLTPMHSPTEIDENGIQTIVLSEYQRAGFHPEQVSTGAVIITGESARKENAARVLSAISGLAGDFVVATAGTALEGIIAGKGAGTASMSEHRAGVFANIDIGGGTTNIAFFQKGIPFDTCCLDVGGRLIRLDSTGVVTYIAPKIKLLCEKYRIPIAVGSKAETTAYESICKILATAVLEAIGMGNSIGEDTNFLTTDHLPKGGVVPDSITFSGGVADCIYEENNSDFSYGDIGVLLGRAVSAAFFTFRNKVERATETIRATVIGAGTHSAELSGSTITYTKNLFPLKNIPILKIPNEDEAMAEGRFTSELSTSLRLYGTTDGNIPIALSLRGRPNVRFAYVEQLADALTEGARVIVKSDNPVIIIVENDMAKALGQALSIRNPLKDIVCLDMLKAESGDYIDIGAPLAEGRVLPVVIKTLVFS